MTTPPGRRQTFRLVLIKPTHYDEHGYVIQWWKSPLPANSLACLHGLALHANATRALGPDVEIEIDSMDETNKRVLPRKLAKWIKAADHGMVMMVGVQSNQFPRTLDLTAKFRDLGVQVAIGGFHVSGTLSMLPGVQPEVQRAIDLGASIFAGEAEHGRLEEVMRDAMAGSLKPIYNYMNDLPALEGVPIPMLPVAQLKRIVKANSSFDAGRGCPYQCSFCTIINVQGRKSRRRSPDDIEAIVRENARNGIFSFFVTDDNFARNKDWEAIFDRLIELKEKEGYRLFMTLQVDTLCHKLPRFIEKAAAAGVNKVFIGLENISPDNLAAAKKKQNHITDYRVMLLKWRRHNVMTHAGYILGFPADTPERILRDIKTIQQELPIDVLEFFFLTPLPGSEDHQKLHKAGIPMDPDLNNYDLHHICADHNGMSKEAWTRAYHTAWDAFYTPEHVETLLRRYAAAGNHPRKLVSMINWFSAAIRIEGVHPLECGLFRFKYRRDRRPGFPIESPLVFYPRFVAETARKAYQFLSIDRARKKVADAILADPNHRDYTDTALTLPDEHDTDTLAMFNTDEAKAYVVQERRLAAVRVGKPEPVAVG